MSDDKTPGDGDARSEDEAMLGLLTKALTEDGELLPTTEHEVAEVESELEETALPASLERLRFDRGAEVSDLQDYRQEREHRTSRSSVWTHGLALVVGAAAVFALRVGLRDGTVEPALSGDPAGAPSGSVPTPEKQNIRIQGGCEGCCAGSACDAANQELTSCASGRTCVTCDAAQLADSRYRLRVGAVTAAPLGQQALSQYPKGDPELCFRAGVAKEVCIDTLISDRTGGRWNRLPHVFSGEDLAAKLTVRLRWKGVARESLATAGVWTMPVAVSPKALCSGYRVELLNPDKGELFGTVSLFLDDTHHVEIARGAGTAGLRDMRERLTLDGVQVQLFESSETGDARFVLALGPFNRTRAEQLRWQLLEQDVAAVVGLGLDYVGDPLPLP